MLKVSDEGEYMRVEVTEPHDQDSLDAGISQIRSILDGKSEINVLAIYPDQPGEAYEKYMQAFPKIPELPNHLRKVRKMVVVTDADRVRRDATSSVIVMPDMSIEAYKRADLDTAEAFVSTK